MNSSSAPERMLALRNAYWRVREPLRRLSIAPAQLVILARFFAAYLRCIARAWSRSYSEDLENLEFNYAGPSSGLFEQFDFRPRYLIDHGYVPHVEAVALRFESHVQLFAQPASFKPHVISGKIYEMIRTGVPIVAITNPAGSVAGTRAGVIVDSRAAEGGIEAVRELYRGWKEGRPTPAPDMGAVRSYSREAQAAQLAEVLGSLVPVS